MREQILAAEAGTVDSSVTTPSEVDSKKSASKTTVTLVSQVLALQPGNKEQLPVPIQSNLPHLSLQLGPSDCDSNPINISCLVDTAASLTNGNFYFCQKLAKTFPWLVHSVLTSDTYAPITLSGIVHQDGSAVTTELPVAFVFHLPYKTTAGDNTTLSVATGPHTGVNFILGLPFMEAVGMVVDLSDNVADCRNLSCPPFPLSKKRAQVQVPAVDVAIARYGGNLDNFNDLLAELDELERHVTRVYANSVAPSSSKRKVTFGPGENSSSDSLLNAAAPSVAASEPTPSGVPHLPASVIRGDDADASDIEDTGILVSDGTE